MQVEDISAYVSASYALALLLLQGLSCKGPELDVTDDTEDNSSEAGAAIAHTDLLLDGATADATSHAAHQQDGSFEWQQAYDPSYGCLYYYRESTQVTSS